MAENDLLHGDSSQGDANKVKGFVYDFVRAVYEAQGNSDASFIPEAERLSAMYRQAGIITNISIVDVSKEGIGLDRDWDGKADEYLDRNQFINSADVHADNMWLNDSMDTIVQELPDEGVRVIETNGTISTYDEHLRLREVDTLYDLPELDHGPDAPDPLPTYERIKLSPDSRTAEITDIWHNKAQAQMQVGDNGDITLTVGGTSRVLDKEGHLKKVISSPDHFLEFRSIENPKLAELGFTVNAPAELIYYENVADGASRIPIFREKQKYGIIADPDNALDVTSPDGTHIEYFDLTANNKVSLKPAMRPPAG